MTWTFDETANPISDQDQIRILVQDVDADDPLVSDETIALYLTGGALAQSDVYLSAAAVAGLIATKFARMASSVSAGGTSVSWADRAEFYRDLQTALTASTSSASAAPYAGGIGWADRMSRESDTDRVAPYFDREPAHREPSRTEYWR